MLICLSNESFLLRLWKLWNQFIFSFFWIFSCVSCNAVWIKAFDYHLCSSLKLNGELCGRLAGLNSGLVWHWQSIATEENLQLFCSVVVKAEFNAKLGKGFRAFCCINYWFPKKPKPSLSIPRRWSRWSTSLRVCSGL